MMLGPVAAAMPPQGPAAVAGWVYFALGLAGVAVTVILLIRSRLAEGSVSLREPVQVPPSPLPPVWAGALAILLLVLHMGFQLSLPFCLRNESDPASSVPTLLVIVQSLLFHGAALAFVAAFLVHRRIHPLRAFGIRPSSGGASILRAVLFYLVALPHVMMYGWLARWGLDAGGYETVLQPVVLIMTGPQPLWMMIYLVGLAVVLAPVIEEVVFRGIMLPLLLRKMGVAPAVILVSAFFAALHMNVASMVPLFVIGVAFSLAYLRTGDLATPIFMHAVFNAVNVGLLLYLAQTS